MPYLTAFAEFRENVRKVAIEQKGKILIKYQSKKQIVVF